MPGPAVPWWRPPGLAGAGDTDRKPPALLASGGPQGGRGTLRGQSRPPSRMPVGSDGGGGPRRLRGEASGTACRGRASLGRREIRSVGAPDVGPARHPGEPVGGGVGRRPSRWLRQAAMSPARYFYSRRIDVSLASVKCFHQLASAYGAEQLQSFCGRLFALLLPQDPSFQTPLELYAYALASQDPVLEEVCTQFLAWNFGALIQTEAWPRVPTSLLQALLSRSELAVPSELAVLQALDKWSRERQASHGEVAGLLREVRFPMMLPEDLFQLQFNVSLYRVHEALFQKKILQALEFHTVPVRLLAQYGGRNLTEAAYWPRLYTSPTWSASLRDQSASGSWVSYAGPGRSSYNPYNRRTSYYEVASRSYYPSRSFRTPQHPSFLFQAKMVSWSFYYLPTMQSCWNYGISCSSEEPPLLALTKSDYTDPSIGYENKALVFCEERFVAHVVDFRGQKAKLPSPSGTNGSRSEAYFPCSPGPFSSFQVVVRPFYLTNSSNAGL
ncbi:Galectin-3-binding protein [Galemys pyrenaicus]|uniref:Galectin-3-binding protein n=1 Tax=Galemys pyrenaicus TaxID=202257 RepID=A0A8J5ZV66_GALPY|nr:Galectin-3-binding protein [Galemys pyrenaicus]